MNIVISHGRTKREIKGPFHICMSRADMVSLRDQLTARIDADDPWSYGWVCIDDPVSEPPSGSVPEPWEK